jgi:hypothetical protein
MNLTRLMHDYPIYQCKGAEEALLAMAPEWKPDDVDLQNLIQSDNTK